MIDKVLIEIIFKVQKFKQIQKTKSKIKIKLSKFSEDSVHKQATKNNDEKQNLDFLTKLDSKL